MTPVGIYHFTKAFGIAPDPGSTLPYTQVDATHYWVGDSASPLYNTFVSTREHDNFSKKESEQIVAYTMPYQYVLNISYNESRKPHLGSAIFLHCYSKNPYTAGCVAVPESMMVTILRNLKADCVIVIDNIEKIVNY